MPDDMDWRLQGVMFFNEKPEEISDPQNIPTETIITLIDKARLQDGRILAFPIPNPSAMMLHASKKAFDEAQRIFSNEALKRSPRDFFQFSSNADAMDFAESIAISIFSAYTALECFANENTPPWLTYKKIIKKNASPLILNKEEIEREVNLGIKLNILLPIIFEIKSPKGTKIWEDFVNLEKVRNRIVHMKHDDKKSNDIDKDTIWKTMLKISSPHQTAKKIIDYFFDCVPHIAGLAFNDFRPVRPRWHVEHPK